MINLKRLTEGGKARRILLHPDGFFKDDFRLLTNRDLAEYLQLSGDDVDYYQHHVDQLSPELTKQLAELFNRYHGSFEEEDPDTDKDVEEKVKYILNNPQMFWDDEANKPFNTVSFVKLLGIPRPYLYKYRKDYSEIPENIKDRLVKLYNSLLRVDEMPEPRDDYLKLLKQVKTEDEVFKTLQEEIPKVIDEGLKRVNIDYYTKEVLDTFVSGIKVDRSTLLRVIIMKMHEQN